MTNLFTIVLNFWGILIPVPFLVYYHLSLKKGKKVKLEKVKPVAELPDNLLPGEVGYLAQGSYTINSFLGDLFYLLARGYLKIERTRLSLRNNLISKFFFQKKHFIVFVLSAVLLEIGIIFLLNIDGINRISAMVLIFAEIIIFLLILYDFKEISTQSKEPKDYRITFLKDWSCLMNLENHHKILIEKLFFKREKTIKISQIKNLKKKLEIIEQEILKRMKNRNTLKEIPQEIEFKYFFGASFIFLTTFIAGFQLRRYDLIIGGLLAGGSILLLLFTEISRIFKCDQELRKIFGFIKWVKEDKTKDLELLPFIIALGLEEDWTRENKMFRIKLDNLHLGGEEELSLEELKIEIGFVLKNLKDLLT